MINEIASFVLTEIGNDKSCSLDVEEVEAIEKLTSFEAMKCDPRSNYEHWDTFGIRNTNEAPFMRAGVVGDHKKHLHPQIENEVDEWIHECQLKLDTPVNFKYTI